ncbi:unnamed protein product, partial [Rhizoctonia solani]
GKSATVESIHWVKDPSGEPQAFIDHISDRLRQCPTNIRISSNLIKPCVEPFWCLTYRRRSGENGGPENLGNARRCLWSVFKCLPTNPGPSGLKEEVPKTGTLWSVPGFLEPRRVHPHIYPQCSYGDSAQTPIHCLRNCSIMNEFIETLTKVTPHYCNKHE